MAQSLDLRGGYILMDITRARLVPDNPENVSATTEEQSAPREEIAASSQELAKMAEELTQAVRRFKI